MIDVARSSDLTSSAIALKNAPAVEAGFYGRSPFDVLALTETAIITDIPWTLTHRTFSCPL